jgi:hypothetical protein
MNDSFIASLLASQSLLPLPLPHAAAPGSCVRLGCVLSSRSHWGCSYRTITITLSSPSREFNATLAAARMSGGGCRSERRLLHERLAAAARASGCGTSDWRQLEERRRYERVAAARASGGGLNELMRIALESLARCACDLDWRLRTT